MNTMEFTEEQVKQGHLLRMVELLLDYNNSVNDVYNDIHIKPGDFENRTILEWETTPYNDEGWGGKFKLVEANNFIATEVLFPDNTVEVVDANLVDEAWKAWEEDHPEWTKDEYGNWYDRTEETNYYEV